MAKARLLKPAPGRQVRKPDNYEYLAEKGETVEMTSYWFRRLKAGDVVDPTIKTEVTATEKNKGSK